LAVLFVRGGVLLPVRTEFKRSDRPGTGLYEEATQSVPRPVDPTDPGDAADLSTPQGFQIKSALFTEVLPDDPAEISDGTGGLSRSLSGLYRPAPTMQINKSQS